MKRFCLAALLFSLALLSFSGRADAASSQFLGSHSMLSNDTPYSAKEAMFREAKDSGATTIRVDLFLQGIFQKGFLTDPNVYWQDWKAADQYKALGEKYGIEVLPILSGTPYYNIDCPSGVPFSESYKCPPLSLSVYKDMVSQVAKRYEGSFRYYEIINEPDLLSITLPNNPGRYGQILDAAADAIHSSSSAKVVMGGLSNSSTAGLQYFDSMLSANSGLRNKIDVCNIHIRGSSTGVVSTTQAWDNKCASNGINNLWVTEYGYPADSAYQGETAYRTGESGQAQFIKDTLPKMVINGGDKVFVTLRDWGGGWFASEGILDSDDPLTENPVYRRRAAFSTVQNLFPAPPDIATAEMVARRYSFPGSPLKELTTNQDLINGFRRYRAPISPCFVSLGVQDSTCPASGAYAEVAVNSGITVVSYLIDGRLLYTRGGLTSDGNMSTWSHVAAGGATITSSLTVDGYRSELRNAFNNSINNQKQFILKPLSSGNQPGVAINFSSESSNLFSSSQRMIGYFPAPMAYSSSYLNSGALCLPGQSCLTSTVAGQPLTLATSMFSSQRTLPNLNYRYCGQNSDYAVNFTWQANSSLQIVGSARSKTICL